MDGTGTLEANARPRRRARRGRADRRRGRAHADAAFSKTLSQITGAEIWLKFENLQFTAAYKERGALNALLLLDDEQRSARRDRGLGRQPCAGPVATTAPGSACR